MGSEGERLPKAELVLEAGVSLPEQACAGKTCLSPQTGWLSWVRLFKSSPSRETRFHPKSQRILPARAARLPAELSSGARPSPHSAFTAHLSEVCSDVEAFLTSFYVLLQKEISRREKGIFLSLWSVQRDFETSSPWFPGPT